MILYIVLKTYFKDVKEIGKENLAVPLSERLLVYFSLYVFPIAGLLIYYLTHII